MRFRPLLPLLLPALACSIAPAGTGTPLVVDAESGVWAGMDAAALPGTEAPAGLVHLDFLLLRGPLDAATPLADPAAWRVMAAPRLVSRLGQSCTISVLDQTAYVRDCTLLPAAGGTVADPEVDVVESGLRLDARAEEVAGDLRCELLIHRSRLLGLHRQDVDLAPGAAPATVQLPELSQQLARAELAQAGPGSWLLQLPLLPGCDELEILAVRIYRAGDSPPVATPPLLRLAPASLAPAPAR